MTKGNLFLFFYEKSTDDFIPESLSGKTVRGFYFAV